MRRGPLCYDGRAELEGRITGIRFGRGPSLSHLPYADDSLIFAGPCTAHAIILENMVNDYAWAWGQLINFEKSSLYCCHGVEISRKQEMCGVLGVNLGDGHGKYLGLPFMTGHNRKGCSTIYTR